MESPARLYIGEVAHQWTGNESKRFRFPAPGLFLPLSELESLTRDLSLFSISGRTPLTLDQRDLSKFRDGTQEYLLTSPRYFGVSQFPFHCSFGQGMRTVFRQPAGKQSWREWTREQGPGPGSWATYVNSELGAQCRVGVFPEQLDLTMEVPGRFQAWWRGYGRPLNDRELAAVLTRFPMNLLLNGIRRRLYQR